MSKSPRHRRPLIEALEPRLLFSATADIAVFDDGASDGQYLAQAAEQVDLVSIYMPSEPLAMNDQVRDIEPQADLPLNESPTITAMVFVDTAVAGYETLVEDIRARVDADSVAIVYLDPLKNGVDQITAALSQYAGLSALHIISHGSAGTMELGSSRLSVNNIAQYEESLVAWRSALNGDADILLYGCDLAVDAAGQQLVEKIAAFTQADVAASDDFTGHQSLQGDWDLEFEVGDVASTGLISAEAQEAWVSVLATTHYVNIQGGTSSQAFSAMSNIGQTFLYDSPGATYTINQISVQLKKDPTAVNQSITLELRSGGWDGSWMGNTTISSNTLTSDFEWKTFSLGNLALNDNQTYCIRLISTGSDGKVFAAYSGSNLWNNSELIVNGTANSSADLSLLVSYSDGLNSAPTVANAIPNQAATEDAAFNFQFAANTFADADVSNTLTYTAQLAGGGALPSWLSFDAATRTFSGTPLNANVGTVAIDVIANDGNGGTVTDTFNIAVANTNDAPTLANPISDQAATEEALYSFTFAANTFNDIDGNTLTYTADLSNGNPLPAWLSFNAGTRTFSGVPDDGDVGTITVRLTANDGNGATVIDTFDLVVSNVNDVPFVNTPVPNQNATEDAVFNYTFPANTFGDGDVSTTFTYTAELAGGGALPAWLNFDSATRTFSGTPANGDVGTISIKLTVNDGVGGTATDTFDLVVANTNDAPTVANAIANQTATENSLFNFTFAINAFNDQDVGNTLTYTAQLTGGGALPAWLSFDGATRTFSGTPSNGDVGNISIEVIANDGTSTVSDFFDLQINNVGSSNVIYETSGPAGNTQSISASTPFFQSYYHNSPLGFYTIDSIVLQLVKDPAASAQTITVTLLFANHNGTEVDSATVSSADIGTTIGWKAFDFTNTVLTDNQLYFIRIESSSNDGLVRAGIHNTNVYPNGSFHSSTGVADISRDVAFQVSSGVNNNPTIANPIPNQNATEDAVYNFQFNANTFNDADVGDTLIYSATMADGSALPTWLSFNAGTRTFSGTPTNADVGTVSIKVTADDGQGGTVATDTFDLVVANSNDAPTVANAIPNQNASEDSVFNYTFATNTFADQDAGNTLTYSAQLAGGGALPAWLSFDAATRTFSGTPLNANVGTVSIDVIASDGNGGTVTDTFNILVANTNDTPIVANAISNQNATEDSAFNFQFAANTFSDPDVGDILTYSAQMAGGGALPGWLSFNAATRTFSGTPTNSDVGNVAIEVIASDGNGGTITDSFDIAIANTNDTPTLANPISDQSATEEALFSFAFAANTFNDIDGNTLTYTADLSNGDPLPAWLGFNAGTRTFSGVPDNGDVGTITVRLTANDGNGATVIDTFNLVVSNVNDVPVVNTPIPNQNATEDAAFNFQFAANTFTDVDVSTTLTYTAQLAGGGALPAWLSFDAVTRTFSGTPANGDVGTISIDVIANDGNGGSVTDTFDLVVANTNDAPTVANAIANQNATENLLFNYSFPINTFSDPDVGDTLTYSAELAGALPLPGWLTFDGNTRTFSGTPSNGDVGPITVRITATDVGGSFTTHDFDIVVQNVGSTNSIIDTSGPTTDTQVLSPGQKIYQSFTNNFGTGTYTIDSIILQLEKSQFAAVQTITVTLLAGAYNGTVVDTATISSNALGTSLAWEAFDFTNNVLNDSTVYYIAVESSGSDGLIAVGIHNTNAYPDGTLVYSSGTPDPGRDLAFQVASGANTDPVLLNPISPQSATEDAAFNFQFASNTFNDADVGDTLTYTATLDNGDPLPAWLNFNSATRTFSGTPTNADVGTISIRVTADDGNGGTSPSDTFDLVIANSNDAPTIANAIPNQNAIEDSAFNFTFPINTFADQDVGNTLTYSAQLAGGGALPAWLSFDAVTRTFSGTPANANVGTVSIDVIASDGNGGTVTDTFNILVANTNDTPTVANAISNQNATEDSAFNFQFAANTFADIDVSDTLTYSVQLAGGGALPTWLSFDAVTRTFSGTPANGDVGTVSIDVIANDGNGGTVTDTFNIVVANTNDAPTIANAIPNQSATEDSAFNFQFAVNTFNDADVGNTLTYTAQLAGGGALPTWLSFDAVTRTLSGTPLNANVGTVSIDVIANDANGGTVTDTFDIVVANSNDAPIVANVIPNQNATEDAAFNFQFAANVFADVDVGNTLTYTAQLAGGGALPTWLSFDAATRTFSGTPLNANVGTVSIDVIANDGNGGTVTDTFDIVVANSNDAPIIANAIPNQNATEDAAFNFQFAANVFADVDVGNTLTYTAQLAGGGALPTWLSFDAVTRTFSGTPLNANVGTVSIDVIANDGNGGMVTDTFDIVVANSNDTPTIVNAISNQNATEDSAFNFQFAVNTFADIDVGDTLTYSAQLAGGGALPAWLSFDAVTRTFSGTPANGDVGTVSIDVIADDGNGGTVTDTFNIVIANVNDAPTIANAIPNQNATEDATFNFQFAANVFADVDVGNTLTYTAQLAGGGALPTWLSFDAVTRTFSGTPANGDVGTVSIDVIANDGNGGTVTDTFNIVVANTNDAPTVANAIPNQNATEDSAFSFQFAANTFADADVSDTLTYSVQLAGGGALPAWLSFDAVTRTFSGTPANGDIGAFAIDVIANDGNGGTITDTFTITVGDVNDAPTVANAIPNQNATEDSAFNFQFAANTFADVDVSDTLTYSVQLAGGGALPAWLSFDAVTRTFSGTPVNADVGTVSIDVIADDGNGGTATDTFNIVVANVNDAPTVANLIPNQNATEDSAFNFQFAANTFADVDASTTLTYTAQLAGGGTLPAWLSFDAVTRTFSGTPANGDVGTVSIDVIASDGSGGTVTDTFNIVIANVNDAPTIANAIPNQSVTEDSAFNFQFAANTFADVDASTTLTYSAQLAGGGALPAWLSFDAATRTFSGTPENGDVGTVSIDVIADDGSGGTVTDTFNIVVTNVNDAPTLANPIADQNATENSAFNFTFPANTFDDQDADAVLTFAVQQAGGDVLPSWLSFDAATRTFSGTPANGDVGTVSIDVIASDGNGGVVIDTFDIVITNTNNAPTVANPIPNQTATEDIAFNFQFAANTFTDIDAGSTLTYSVQLAGGGALPAWLSFDAVTRTFSGTPANGDVGSLAIDVIASDGQGGTVTDTFALAIANTNDVPTLANPIADQIANEDAPFGFTIPANTFLDVDGDALNYSAQLAGGGALPAWLSFDAATRTFSGTPTGADLGSVSVQVSVSDGQGGTLSDTFVINVTNINDAPVLVNPPANQTAVEDIPFTVIFGNTMFADPDANTTLVYTAQLANGEPLPDWLSFDAATLSFSGTPANGDTGMLTVRIIASDGIATTNAQFQLTVSAVNDAPQTSGFSPINNREDAAGDTIDLWAGFSDEETAVNQLQFTLVSNSNPALVSGATIDPVTGNLQLRYGANQFGSSELVIRAQDSQGAIVETTLRVNIDSVNDAPTSRGIADMPVLAGTEPQQTNLHSVFSDIEQGAQLQYSLVGNSNAAVVTDVQIDADTGVMTLTFSADTGGESFITLRAQDAEGAWVETRFKVTVVAATIPIPEVPDTDPPTVPPVMPPLEQPEVELPEVNPPGTGGGTGGGAGDDSPAPGNPDESVSPLLPGMGIGPNANDDSYGRDDLVNDKSSRDYLRLEESLEDGNVPVMTLTASSTLASLIAPDAGFAPWEAEDFDNEVRRLRAQMDEALEDEQHRKAVVAGLTFSVTTGLLVWSLRASSLLLTMMSMLPLWRGIDPLPILDEVNKKKKELEQQRKDRAREDKNAKEVGYLFDHAQGKKTRP